MLLAAGANPDARDAKSRTPLHHACAAQHREIARALRAKGADPELVDDDGNLGWFGESRDP